MNVLFITNHYLDRNIGGPNASKGFLKVFSSIFNHMSLIFPDNHEGHINDFIPLNVEKIPHYDNRTQFQKLIDVYRGRLHGYHKFIKKHLKTNRYDLIIIDHSVIWSSLTTVFKGTKSTIITIHHNVEKDYHRDNPAHWLFRIPVKVYGVRAERDALLNSNVNLTLTKEDIVRLQKMYPSTKGSFYHLGVFDYQDLCFNISKNNDPKTFIITGALSFPQSNYPIMEFLKEYYPIVCRMMPDNTLIIAGREPTEELERTCKHFSSIQLIKNPPEMLPLLNRASYYICPINMGSGQKTRVADGFKSGLPVLCHEISSYGYEEMIDRGFLFFYHDKESFEKAFVDMIKSSYSQFDVYNAYEDCYGIKAGVKRISEILKKENIIF